MYNFNWRNTDRDTGTDNPMKIANNINNFQHSLKTNLCGNEQLVDNKSNGDLYKSEYLQHLNTVRRINNHIYVSTTIHLMYINWIHTRSSIMQLQ